MKGISLLFMLFFWLAINTLNTFCIVKLIDKEMNKEKDE